MNKSASPGLNLEKICRACLRESQNTSNMHQNKELLQKFAAITNIELDALGGSVSLLCTSCEAKLDDSYEFRELCRKSHDILTNPDVIPEVPDEQTQLNLSTTRKSRQKRCSSDTTDVKIELKDENFEETYQGDWKGNDSDSDYIPNRKNKPNQPRQVRRLAQYSVDEVSQALEKTRRMFLSNNKCKRCEFVGSNMRALSVHMAFLHKDLKERWCVQCNDEFDDLTEHQKMHQTTDTKCELCGKEFRMKGHLLEHLYAHSGVRPYKCEVCLKRFISPRHLKLHFRIHTNERPYKCSVCPRAFIQYNSLKCHLKTHKKLDECTCRSCHQVFSSKEDLKAHACMKTEAEGLENCEADAKSTLEYDERIDHVAAQNYCTVCKKKVRSLTAHNQQIHNEGKKKVLNEYGDVSDTMLCNICAKQFKTLSKLRVHMRIHTGETPYKCKYCERRVSTRNHLVLHERTHTGEKPHICHVCGKGFAQSSVLTTHMRIHTGRPEICKICGQGFCRPAELRLHMRKHTGEKPYLCTECGQAFIQRSHLVEHNKTHSDLRPYQCTYCDKAFKQNSSLKSHIQIHLGRKPYKCSQCPYACRQSYSLTQHMKQHAIDAPKPDRPHLCVICSKNFSTVAMLTSHASAVHQINSNLFEESL